MLLLAFNVTKTRPRFLPLPWAVRHEPESQKLRHHHPASRCLRNYRETARQFRAAELSPPEPDYSVASVPNQWKIYAARLAALSEFWHGHPLKEYEAEYVPYVGAAFNDPLGEEVDLIPQLAVVREVAHLYIGGRTREFWEHSIEHYFTYAPWKFGWEFAYEQQKEWTAHVKEQKVIVIEPIDFFMSCNSEDNWREVSPVFEDALRQLGLPWAAMYQDVGVVTPFLPNGEFKFETNEFYGDESKGKCKWNTIIRIVDTIK